MLMSVQQLGARGGLLEPTLEAVRQHLASQRSGQEATVVRASANPPQVTPLCDEDLDEDHVQSLFASGEGLYVMPFPWEREFFVDARKPNESGAAPLSGSY